MISNIHFIDGVLPFDRIPSILIIIDFNLFFVMLYSKYRGGKI